MTDEQWRSVSGYEGYEVSDQGRVRSLDRWLPCGNSQRFHRGRVLKPVSAEGYLRVMLSKDRWELVHRLVLAAFIGPCPPGMEGCHRDGNSTDCRLSNLRWGTKSANTLDQVAHGTHKEARKTHCRQGHPFSVDNTYIERWARGEKRQCRTCVRIRMQRHRDGTRRVS